MALRYVARRALQQQRALVPRVPLSARSRTVCTCGSSPPPQGVLINESKAAAAASKGNKEPELLHTDSSKLMDAQIWQKLDKINSMCKAVIEDHRVAARNQAIDRWCFMGSLAVGYGLAFLHIAYDMHKEGSISNSFLKIICQIS